MPMKRTILHIDFDSFFASAEQQFDPNLRGKPIGVTAQNGRTCIIAASREAKALGVKSPSRTFEAMGLVPGIVFVPAHFQRYWEITQKFLNICKDYSPYVELFSLDEVFMDVTLTGHLFGGPYGIADKIKERIRNEIGEYITASFGISYNKTLAKLASGLEKPNGLVEIREDNFWKIYTKAKLTDICGIGERIALRLNKIGVYSLADLQKSSYLKLLREFGKAESQFLRNVSLGIDNNPVIPYNVAPEVKSIGRNYCLPHNEYDQRVVFQNVYELCEEVAIKLRRLEKKARTGGIYLGGNKNVHGRKTTDGYFETGQDFFKLCRNILKENNFVFDKYTYVRRISVWTGGLWDSSKTTLSLFESDKKQDSLWKTVDRINNKFGDHTIRNGFLLYADKLTTVPNGYMADRSERTRLALSEP